MNELKGGWNYAIGDYVRYRLESVPSSISYPIRRGYIKEICVKIKDGHKYYRITDDRYPHGGTWSVEPEWIFGYAVKNESEDSLKDFLNKIYGISSSNKEDNKMKNQQQKRNRNIIKTEKYQRTIKDITFNGPAVIVKFEPTGDDIVWGRTKGDKVVVVCKDGDKYDMKTGFLLAILKEFLNNQSYGNILEKLDSFDTFDIPKIEKEKIFNELDKAAKEWNHIDTEEVKKKDICDPSYKFQVGDIVRLKHGKALFKVLKQSYWKFGPSKRIVNRYRIQSLNASSKYTTYEVEKRLELVKRGE